MKGQFLLILTAFILVVTFSAGCTVSDSPATTPSTPVPTAPPTGTQYIGPTTPPAQTPPPVPTTTGTDAPENRLITEFIDVGQGDAILIQCNGKNMLVDAGDDSMGDRVVSELTNLGVSALDVVVATHPHADHIGGMDEVLDAFPVSQFYDSGNTDTTKTYEEMVQSIDEHGIPYETVERGDRINLDPILSIQVLNPGPTLTGDLNEDSVVLMIQHGSVDYLFMGDAGNTTESELLTTNYPLDIEILKVGHHGSKCSSSPQFLSTVTPETSIIMVGQGNRYGHPSSETLTALQNIGSTIYRTECDGDIIVTSNENSYTVTTEPWG